MRQLLQQLDSGATSVEQVPSPVCRPHAVLVRTAGSVISRGTEQMLVDFARASTFTKARQQPERVRQVVDKVRADGIVATAGAVRNQLSRALPLGYCSAGVVEEVGSDVTGLRAGDRVATNGPHAEYAAVGRNLVAPMPDGVSFEEAAFTPLAAIALHGARLARPTLGEQFVVIGLGLVGLLAVQVLRAHGCDVLGVDPNPDRVDLARGFGAQGLDTAAGEDPVAAARDFSGGLGVDGVLVAAATKADEPIQHAAEMCRKKGRIVLVGVTGTTLSRTQFYEKELSFQVSCSYGPGRYDERYEEDGEDYPLAYARWTQGRNFQAVLGMMARGTLQTGPLITHRFPFTDAPHAYDLLTGDEPSLGIVLNYEQPDKPSPPLSTTVTLGDGRHTAAVDASGTDGVGVIGAGAYANATLLPNLAAHGADLRIIASSGGTSAGRTARRFGFARASSDPSAVLDDPTVRSLFVLTRHDAHPDLVVAGLQAGKVVFVEKPLAIDTAGLERVREALVAAPDRLTVGFNRRFSAHVQTMSNLLRTVQAPKALVMTVNAGELPAGHWLKRHDVGGGRLIGEGCHFVDLLRHLVDAPITDVDAHELGTDPADPTDSFQMRLRFTDGSLGTIHYYSNGHRRHPKERLDVFTGGRTLTLDNFTRLRAHGWRRFRGLRTRRQDKGHRALIGAFLDAAASGAPPPIPTDEMLEVAEVSIRAADLARRRR